MNNILVYLWSVQSYKQSFILFMQGDKIINNLQLNYLTIAKTTF